MCLYLLIIQSNYPCKPIVILFYFTAIELAITMIFCTYIPRIRTVSLVTLENH